MNCDQARKLLDAYADGELDALNATEVESHIQSCPTCAAALAELQSLHRAMSAGSLYYAAPAALRTRIASAVAAETARPARPPTGDIPVPVARWRLSTAFLAVAACALLAVGLLWLTVWQPSRGVQSAMLDEVIGAHVRSLMAAHLVDIHGPDQHTIKPWFNGKIDFAPDVRNLGPAGFELEGGRLEYLDGRSVAALIYGRLKHHINVFIWPAPDGSSPTPVGEETAISRQGYTIIHWVQAGMNYWAISDIAQPTLVEFVGLLRATPSVQPATR